jgi:glucosamine--fructose-6-phosphate aminotransferase (isomerizing)
MSDPELRDGPPWVMEEMIQAEATLPREIESAGRLGELLAAGGPVLFTGCGTSEHASRASAAIAGGSARDAFEASLDPPREGLVVAVSHDAGTEATLAAATGAAAAGATAVLLTARPEEAPQGLETIATPRRDLSWCHTIGYLSPLLTTALAAGALTVDAAERVIATELGARGRRREDAERLAGATRLLAIGSGVDEITAAELALKIEEGTHVPTTPLGTEKSLHGHLPAADATTGVVLLRFDPSYAGERDARAGNLAAATAVLDMPLVELRPQEPPAGAAEALLAGAIALQLLTLELTHVLGTNPDLIRREDERYRRVAEAAGAG